MDEVFVFNKTYQERYQEYLNVFDGCNVSGSAVKKQWSYYLELTLDPNGWQAIWKISRLKCEKLKISFPTIVLVYVENVNFEDLMATVKILAVQDDIPHVPNKHYIPLTQLWVTKNQDKSICLNTQTTANSLDMLHFFYMNIFMPWDFEDDSTNWTIKNLESRLHLCYDMKNGKIPRATAERLQSLLIEAHRLQARKEQMELEVDKALDTVENDNCIQRLLKIHIMLVQIRTEVELLENPMLRSTLLHMQQEELPENIDKGQKCWIIFEEGEIDEFISFLKRAKEQTAYSKVKSVSSLSLALNAASPKDTIILNPSKHIITTLGGLKEGGILQGLHSKLETIIYTTNENIMLDINGDVTLENLSIDVQSAQIGILVRCGTTTLKNCRLIGDGKSTIRQGIVVLSGGKLSMVDCEIEQFYTAVVGNSESSIDFKNCEISAVSVGLKIYDNCNAKVEDSKFSHCRDYGIHMITNEILPSSGRKVGNFTILQTIPNVLIRNVQRANGGKEDVIIDRKLKLIPVDDLFANPDLNPTLTNYSDDDMDININNDDVHSITAI